jgi:hypothetical protein
MDDSMTEVHNALNAQYESEDRERQYRRDEDNYEDNAADEVEQMEYEIYKPGEPLLPKMMGEDYPKFFQVLDPEQAYEVEQERNIDHARDNSI